MNDRRAVGIGLLGFALLPLTGCTTQVLQPVRADGSYCHRIGKRYQPKLTCTPTAVPTDAEEAAAKRFDPDPAALTVYVLRRRWADASVVLPVSVDGTVVAVTLPESLLRLRLKPGSYRLSAQWEGQALDIAVEGRAGDLRVVELVGSAWVWGARFSWQAAQADTVKARAQASKLVADLDLRR